MSHYDISVRKHTLLTLIILSVLLSGCSKGLSSAEELACDAHSESWDSVDFNEIANFNYLYEAYGVSQLGDNSESAKIITQNKQMASLISDGLKEGDDEDLRQLTSSHYLKWSIAASNGLTVLRSVIGTAKDGNTELNSVQSAALNDAISDIAEAEKIAEEIRSRCDAMGHKNSP
jgi:PBP1b-binding outer membrane lipoprotein LpoB